MTCSNTTSHSSIVTTNAEVVFVMTATRTITLPGTPDAFSHLGTYSSPTNAARHWVSKVGRMLWFSPVRSTRDLASDQYRTPGFMATHVALMDHLPIARQPVCSDVAQNTSVHHTLSSPISGSSALGSALLSLCAYVSVGSLCTYVVYLGVVDSVWPNWRETEQYEFISVTRSSMAH